MVAGPARPAHCPEALVTARRSAGGRGSRGSLPAPHTAAVARPASLSVPVPCHPCRRASGDAAGLPSGDLMLGG